MYTKQEVAATIDHAALKPSMTDDDIRENCKLGLKYGVASVCVRPTDVPTAYEMLKDSDVKVSVVVGFPHGTARAETKALEARLAIEDGAREIDMVMNIGKFLSDDYDLVQKEIEAVVAETKPHGVLVKVIQETCYLSNEQVVEACKLCEAAGADYVKTSTGFGDGPATPEVVDIMLKTVGKTMKIKPSGGIRNWETAVGYLEQGADRLGVGSTEQVLQGGAGDGDHTEY